MAISVPVLSEAPFCLLVAVNLAVWTAAWKRGNDVLITLRVMESLTRSVLSELDVPACTVLPADWPARPRSCGRVGCCSCHLPWPAD